VCHARFTLKHSMMRHRRKHEGVTGADVGDAQSDSDDDSLPNNTGMSCHLIFVLRHIHAMLSYDIVWLFITPNLHLASSEQ